MILFFPGFLLILDLFQTHKRKCTYSLWNEVTLNKSRKEMWNKDNWGFLFFFFSGEKYPLF